MSNTLLASECIQGLFSADDGSGNDLRGFVQDGTSCFFSGWLAPNSLLPDVLSSNCTYPFSTNPPCIVRTTQKDYYAARSRHPGGVNAAMCDGSVKFFKNSISLLTWQQVSTTQGGEVVSADSY
jgi:prepilin-type processing-associated H-X9-DG protein